MAKYKARVSITTDYEFTFDFESADEFETDAKQELRHAIKHASQLVQAKSMEELDATSFDGSFDIWDVCLADASDDDPLGETPET